MLPHQEAAAIYAHYIKTLARRSGIRWTEASERDMQRAALLLGQSDDQADTIPPCQAEQERTTVVLDRRPPAAADPASGDAGYQRWRHARQMDDDDRAVARMVNRQ